MVVYWMCLELHWVGEDMATLHIPDDLYKHILKSAQEHNLAPHDWLAQVLHGPFSQASSTADEKLIGDVVTGAKSLAMLQGVFDNALNAILLTDADGKYIEVNPAACQMLGYTRAELLTKSVSDITLPESQTATAATWHEFVGTGKMRGEIILQHKDGRHIIAQYAAVTDIIPGIHMAVISDVTAQKSAELQLEESRNFVEHIADTVPYQLYVFDLSQGKNIYINQKTREFFGMSLEELQQKGQQLFAELMHPNDLAKLAEFNVQWSVASDEDIFEKEYRMKDTTGAYRWLQSYESILKRDEAGNPIQILGTAHDVTEKSIATEAVIASEQKYHELFDTVPIGLFQVDGEGRFLAVNQALMDILGYPDKDGLLRESVMDIHLQAQKYTHALELTNNHTPHVYYPKLLRQDGSVLPAELTMMVHRDESGEILFVHGAIQDITQRQIADQLKKERMELALQVDKERDMARMKSNLFSIMAHEFRTPLTVIKSSASMLEQYWERLSEERRRQKFSNIQRHVEHLADLIQEVSTLARAERGNLDYNPTMTDVEGLCQQVIDDLSDLLTPQHTLSLDMTLTQPTYMMDANLMRLALSNLLSNAIKYSPEGGLVQFTVAEHGDQVHFIVVDEGMGIPLADQSEMFGQFKRGSNVGDIVGTGMGLSIVRVIAKLHEGTVDFVSQVDKGCTFTMRLPLHIS
jgi:PAS domain S-box-containing protein